MLKVNANQLLSIGHFCHIASHGYHMRVPYVLWNLVFVLYAFVTHTHTQTDMIYLRRTIRYAECLGIFSLSLSIFLSFRFGHSPFINIIKYRKKYLLLFPRYMVVFMFLFSCFCYFYVTFGFPRIGFVVIRERIALSTVDVECNIIDDLCSVYRCSLNWLHKRALSYSIILFFGGGIKC